MANRQWPTDGRSSRSHQTLWRDRVGALGQHVPTGVEHPYVVPADSVAGPRAQVHASVVELSPAAVGLLVEKQPDVLRFATGAVDLDRDVIVDPH